MGRMGVYGPLPHVPVPYRPPAPATTTPAPLPANVRSVPFVPFGALLPHVDVMVTNGGYGGVQFALAHGVPLVVAGMSEEKPEIAARVAWSGAGINLKTRRPTPRQIRAAVRTALTDPRYRRSAERIRDDYARHNAPEAAGELLEQLAATGQPVLRQTPRQPVAPRIEAILERLAPGDEPVLGQPPQRPAAPRSHVLADVYERLQEGLD
ncbi:MAG: hypothetical protein HGA45_04200 [Chloroflexales bacterium]|nr:hypothetical protein [Chloroflexales bacterium]